MWRFFVVVEMLKKRYGPCEPIVLSDIKWMKLSSGALRQMFKRMSDKGILQRYMNGVYYFPENGKKMMAEAVIEGMYIANRKERYGYFAGFSYGRRIGVTDREDEYPIIVTNKETSRGRFRMVSKKRVYLKKPYAYITKGNVEEMALLDFIREWDAYSDLNEEDTFSHIKSFMKEKNIDKRIFIEAAAWYPNRVSALLLKHKLA